MGYQYELRHLRYFKAVAEELNFRKAAAKLFISQPGLTRQIKQLEEMLGVLLFQRDKQSVVLTAAGNYLLEEIDVVFAQLKDVENNIRLIGQGDLGEVKIGFLGSAMQSTLGELLPAISHHYKGIHTNLQEMSNRDQIEAILHQKLDIGFVRMQQLPFGIRHKVVGEDTFSVVLPMAHSLDRDSFRSMKQLEDESFIFFSSDYSPHYYDKIMSICTDAGFRPKVSHKSVHAYTIFKLVENGLGIAIVPSVLHKGYDLNVKFIELSNIKQRTILYAIWHQDNRKEVLARVIDLL